MAGVRAGGVRAKVERTNTPSVPGPPEQGGINRGTYPLPSRVCKGGGNQMGCMTPAFPGCQTGKNENFYSTNNPPPLGRLV